MALLAHLLLSISTAGNNSTEAPAARAEGPSAVLAATLQRQERGAGQGFTTSPPHTTHRSAWPLAGTMPTPRHTQNNAGLCWFFCDRTVSPAAAEDTETQEPWSTTTPAGSWVTTSPHTITKCVCELSEIITKYWIRGMAFNDSFFLGGSQ